MSILEKSLTSFFIIFTIINIIDIIITSKRIKSTKSEINDLIQLSHFLEDSLSLADTIGVIDALGVSAENISEETKNDCREFCNQLCSDNYFYAGILYQCIRDNDLLQYLPDIVTSNMKYKDGIKDIDERMKNLPNEKKYNESLQNKLRETINEALLEAKKEKGLA